MFFTIQFKGDQDWGFIQSSESVYQVLYIKTENDYDGSFRENLNMLNQQSLIFSCDWLALDRLRSLGV